MRGLRSLRRADPHDDRAHRARPERSRSAPEIAALLDDVPRLPAPPCNAGGRRATEATSRMRLLIVPAVAVIVLAGVWVSGGVISDDFRTSMALTATWFAISGAACAADRTPLAGAAGCPSCRLHPHRGGRRRLPRPHHAARRRRARARDHGGTGARAIDRADGQSPRRPSSSRAGSSARTSTRPPAPPA